MIHMRRALMRAASTPASSYASTTTTSTRSFVTLLKSSKDTSCTAQLTRPQRSTTILQSVRRTYATEDGKSNTEAAEEQLEDAEEKVSEMAGEAHHSSGRSPDAVGGAATATEAAKSTASAAADTMKQGVGRVGDAMSEFAGTNAAASSNQTSPIREESTRANPEGEKSTSLYIGNLFFEVTPQILQREFAKFGTINSSKVITDARGLSKGFGYIEFATEDDATAARNALDGQVVEGRRIVVQYAIRSGGRKAHSPDASFVNQPSKTLFIGNLSYEMSDKDLNDLFREIKNVLDVRVAIDRRTGQPRGFAHADFIDVKSAEAAAEFLKTKEYYGRRLRIDFASNNAAR